MTNDKKRERLVELIRKGINKHESTIENYVLPIWEYIADYLLANGVIVPPFEIGTRVYTVITNMPFVRADVYECEVVWYALGKDGIRPTVKVKSDNIINGANLGLYLEDLFLTKEEAEQALNNIQNGNSCEGGAE